MTLKGNPPPIAADGFQDAGGFEGGAGARIVRHQPEVILPPKGESLAREKGADRRSGAQGSRRPARARKSGIDAIDAAKSASLTGHR